jgi:predicted nucleic acid-binding protein
VSGAFAIDTNVAFYAFSDDPKFETATGLLEAGPHISVQLLNEFANASLRKRQLTWNEVRPSLGIISSLAINIRPLDLQVHRAGQEIAERYLLGLYDALIVGAALLDECETLYSEDMQHGLIIDDRLTIINPFLDT